jgi:hypothetical protein
MKIHSLEMLLSQPCTSMKNNARPFLSTWHNHCRPNLFLQMLSEKKLWKKESLKRRDMVQESWEY